KTNVFLEHAGMSGAEQCKELFAGMGLSLVGESVYSAMSNWDETSPDQHAINSIVGMRFGSTEEGFSAGGLLFAAPVARGCEGSLIRIAPSSASCDAMQAQLPAGSAHSADLEGMAVYNLLDGGAVLL